MRKREMALARSSELLGEEHQRQAPAEFTRLGELMLGQSFSYWWSRGLQTVTVVCMQSLAPPQPHSPGFKPQFNTPFIKLWKSLVSRWETCKFLVAARFAYKAAECPAKYQWQSLLRLMDELHH